MAEPKFNAKLGLDKKEFDKKLKQAEGGVAKFGNSLKGIAGAAGLAFGATELIRYGAEAVKLAAKAEGIRAAFQRLNNPNLLSNLQKATHNTVADVDLMSAAVRANNFHIALDQLPKYFAFASQRAKDTGESVDYLVDSIVMGIGRKSPMILDNLGISLADINEELKKTPDYATAVGNIIEKSMKTSGEYIGTTADSIAQLGAAMANLKVEVGDMFNEVLAKPLAESAKSLSDVISGISDLRKELALGGVNKDIANQIRGNVAAAGATPGGLFMQRIFGGRNAGKGEIIIEAGNAIVKIDAAAAKGMPLESFTAPTVTSPTGNWDINKSSFEGILMISQEYEDLDREIRAATEANDKFLESVKEIDIGPIDQYSQIAYNIASTFENLFSSGIQGWDEFGKAAVNAIKGMMVKLAAMGALYLALSFIPGFSEFVVFVSKVSDFMNGDFIPGKLSKGLSNSLAGSVVPATSGGNLTVQGVIRGGDIALINARGSNSLYGNT